jgi:hypothetical protein
MVSWQAPRQCYSFTVVRIVILLFGETGNVRYVHALAVPARNQFRTVRPSRDHGFDRGWLSDADDAAPIAHAG